MSRTLTRTGLATAGLLLALTACGGGSDTDTESGTDSLDSATEDLDSVRSDDVPEECVEAFPLALEPVDLTQVALRPADFPEPPVDATACTTSTTLDDSLTIVSYVTDASHDEVIDGYETALADYETYRDDQGLGETLTADLGGGDYVQITPAEGTFALAFGGE